MRFEGNQGTARLNSHKEFLFPLGLWELANVRMGDGVLVFYGAMDDHGST